MFHPDEYIRSFRTVNQKSLITLDALYGGVCVGGGSHMIILKQFELHLRCMSRAVSVKLFNMNS